ncbi:MAG: isoprenylcysteine carboxylmethyltransferase family protein [Candidatus Desantisbacteria bacterium]
MFTGFYLAFIIIAFTYEYLAEASIKRKKIIPGKITSRLTYKLMAISYILLLLGTVAEYFWVRMEINFIVSALGLILYISGIVLRRWAIHSLDKYWSLHVEIKEGHRLIKHGLYKYMRHPNYLAICFKALGFLLIPNSYWMLVYFVIVLVPVRLIRIFLEEKELIKEFGEEYLDYKRQVSGLFPLKIFYTLKGHRL